MWLTRFIFVYVSQVCYVPVELLVSEDEYDEDEESEEEEEDEEVSEVSFNLFNSRHMFLNSILSVDFFLITVLCKQIKKPDLLKESVRITS
jgi:hypothetical protein